MIRSFQSMVALTVERIKNRTKHSDLSHVKKFNCWGSGLTDVSVVKELINAEVIALSINDISTLKPFQHLTNLRELYLRKNKISDINEVLYLKNLPKLWNLWLSENPFCGKAGSKYRAFVINALPQLQKLDEIYITAEERQAAAQLANDTVKTTPEDFPTEPKQSKPIGNPVGVRHIAFDDDWLNKSSLRSIRKQRQQISKNSSKMVELDNEGPFVVPPTRQNILIAVNLRESQDHFKVRAMQMHAGRGSPSPPSAILTKTSPNEGEQAASSESPAQDCGTVMQESQLINVLEEAVPQVEDGDTCRLNFETGPNIEQRILGGANAVYSTSVGPQDAAVQTVPRKNLLRWRYLDLKRANHDTRDKRVSRTRAKRQVSKVRAQSVGIYPQRAQSVPRREPSNQREPRTREQHYISVGHYQPVNGTWDQREDGSRSQRDYKNESLHKLEQGSHDRPVRQFSDQHEHGILKLPVRQSAGQRAYGTHELPVRQLPDKREHGANELPARQFSDQRENGTHDLPVRQLPDQREYGTHDTPVRQFADQREHGTHELPVHQFPDKLDRGTHDPPVSQYTGQREYGTHDPPVRQFANQREHDAYEPPVRQLRDKRDHGTHELPARQFSDQREYGTHDLPVRQLPDLREYGTHDPPVRQFADQREHGTHELPDRQYRDQPDYRTWHQRNYGTHEQTENLTLHKHEHASQDKPVNEFPDQSGYAIRNQPDYETWKHPIREILNQPRVGAEEIKKSSKRAGSGNCHIITASLRIIEELDYKCLIQLSKAVERRMKELRSQSQHDSE